VSGTFRRVYPRETVLAEKFEAMIVMGMRNSRMKDYFDMWVLLRQGGFDTVLLAQAIRATCERRGTALPEGWPTGLDEFATFASKLAQWQGVSAQESTGRTRSGGRDRGIAGCSGTTA
jgi:hypothetical protein